MIVLDASVVLDLVWSHRRSAQVAQRIAGSEPVVIPAVQVAEVASMVTGRGGSWARVARALELRGVTAVILRNMPARLCRGLR